MSMPRSPVNLIQKFDMPDVDGDNMVLLGEIYCITKHHLLSFSSASEIKKLSYLKMYVLKHQQLPPISCRLVHQSNGTENSS